ncbi:MAG TPA: hypothetical protein VIM85_06525 [Pseudomonadales bacterium]
MAKYLRWQALAAGTYVPLAFLLSAIIAGFTAFTYAELSARFPESSGETIYIYNGLGRQGLATLTGLLICGVLSCLYG